MTNTAHMAVRDAIVAALLAAPALAGGKVVANRRRPMAADVSSQIFVYLEDSLASHEIIGFTDWRTRIRIENLARSTALASADDAADALAFDSHARIMADPGLGGRAITTEAAAMAWTEDEADPTLSAAQQIFTVWHRCPDESLSA